MTNETRAMELAKAWLDEHIPGATASLVSGPRPSGMADLEIDVANVPRQKLRACSRGLRMHIKDSLTGPDSTVLVHSHPQLESVKGEVELRASQVEVEASLGSLSVVVVPGPGTFQFTVGAAVSKARAVRESVVDSVSPEDGDDISTSNFPWAA